MYNSNERAQKARRKPDSRQSCKHKIKPYTIYACNYCKAGRVYMCNILNNIMFLFITTVDANCTDS